MPRPPLVLETWGKIRRTTVDGKPTAVAYFRDSDGVTRKMQRQGKTDAAAERNLIQAMKERLTPAGGDLTLDSTLSQLAKKWLEDVEASDRAIATVNGYRGVVKFHIDRGMGQVRLREINVPRVDRYLKRVRDASGPGAVLNVRTVLSGMFKLAARHVPTFKDPMRDVSVQTTKREPVKALRKPDIDAIRALMVAYDTGTDKRGQPRTTDLADITDMFVATGARTGEVLALQWKHLNFDANPATVDITGTLALDANGRVFRQEHTKSQDSMRGLTLPAFAVDMLLRRRVDSYTEWVFPSSTGTLRWQHNLRRQWRDALADTAYAAVTPRAFRKAVATLLAEEFGPERARDQLGHAGTGVTRKHYIEKPHMAPDSSAVIEAKFGKTASK